MQVINCFLFFQAHLKVKIFKLCPLFPLRSKTPNHNIQVIKEHYRLCLLSKTYSRLRMKLKKFWSLLFRRFFLGSARAAAKRQPLWNAICKLVYDGNWIGWNILSGFATQYNVKLFAIYLENLLLKLNT